MPTTASPAYLLRNINGTLDTMVCNDSHIVVTLSRIHEMRRVPFNAALDLRAEELSFSYKQSQN